MRYRPGRERGKLRGDVGAKALLQRHAERMAHVSMPNAALDLDTPEHFRSLSGDPQQAS